MTMYNVIQKETEVGRETKIMSDGWIKNYRDSGVHEQKRRRTEPKTSNKNTSSQ
jgi:hypothetical protein